MPDQSSSVLPEQFVALREAVYEKYPVLQAVLKKHGAKSLFEYAQEYISVNINPPIQKRQDQLIGTFETEVTKRLGADVAKKAALQLRHYYYVSTADHHGPICHERLLNGNLLRAAAYSEKPDPLMPFLIVLPCEDVSLNNPTFPRGLQFHARGKDGVNLHRLSFLPSNSHSSPVHNFRPYTLAEIDKMKKALREKVGAGDVAQRESDMLSGLLDEVYGAPDMFECETYADQMTKANYRMWKKFFSHTNMPYPDLIYLGQETLVIRLLIEHHLYRNTVMNHILFDDAYDALINEYFDGVIGAFAKADMSGTYLFWGMVPGTNDRVQLWKNGRALESKDGSFRVELTPEGIQQALEEKKLMPSMLLVFMTLSFHYGLKCLGGFSQINYLTFMKNAYIKMQVDRGNYKSIEVCARAQTKEICYGLHMAFIRDHLGESIPATGVDLLLYGNAETWPTLMQMSKNMTLEDSLNPMMPGIYRKLYREENRKEELMAVTIDDIVKQSGSRDRIIPFAQL